MNPPTSEDWKEESERLFKKVRTASSKEEIEEVLHEIQDALLEAFHEGQGFQAGL